jgi:hypothetical protein
VFFTARLFGQKLQNIPAFPVGLHKSRLPLVCMNRLRNLRFKYECLDFLWPIAPGPFEGPLEILSKEKLPISMILPTNKMAVFQLPGSPRFGPIFIVITAQMQKKIKPSE